MRRRIGKLGFVWNFPLFAIMLSLFSGALCMLLSGKTAKLYTIILEGILIVFSAAVLRMTLRAGQAFTYVMGEFPAPWGNEIRMGVLEALLALVFLIVMLCSILAGGRFVKEDLDESKVNLYYGLVNLMTAALLALIYTNDIFTGYVFVEILTLTSIGVLIVREIGRTTLAAMRYMILNLLGSGLFLLGVVLLYNITGNLLMVPMHDAIAELVLDSRNIPVLSVALGIVTIGLSIKSGLFPFHYWMPDTYGRATPTSASLLSALVSKAYIFLLIKIYCRVAGWDVLERLPLGRVLMILGMCGIVFGSVAAIRADNINRMTAFSSAAQIGYIFMGIGIGGTAGYTAAVFHILAHAVTKSQIFLTTPRLAEVSGGSLLFRNLRGSALRDRDAGKAFGIGALSMVGLPIFAGFASKILFGVAAVDTGQKDIVFAVLLVLAVSSLLNALYFIRTLLLIYIEPSEEQKAALPGAFKTRTFHHMDYLLPMIVLSLMNFFLGVFSWAAVGWIQAGLAMLG